MLNHSNTTSMKLTPEDKFLIEMLVDGELDESSRRDLLIRLEDLDGGWRFCAITFLEAQCVSETLAGGKRYFHGLEVGAGMSPVAVMNSWQVTSGSVLKGSLGDTPGVEGSSALAALPNSDLQINHEAESVTKNEEPLIIPLHKGGYRARNNRSPYGSGGGGSWHGILAAMAGGFFFALALSGIVALIVYSSNPAVDPVVVNQLPDVKKQPLRNASLDHDPQFQGKQMKMVTFKTKKSDKNGVLVPCFETDDYNVNALNELRAKTSNPQLNKWKKDGRKIETTYEEFVFPYDDGRVLIVPVDTYRVRDKEPHYQ